MLKLIGTMALFLFIELGLHEIGHYVAAKRVGMKNIKFHIFPKGRRLAIFGVSFDSDLETREDLNKINFCLASGSVFSIIGILLGTILDLWSISFGYLMVSFNTLYMFYEVTHA